MMKRSLNRPYSSGRDVVMDVSRGGTGARTSSELVSKLGLIKTTDLGRPGGVAILDREGKIPAEYIPENITMPETGPKIRIEGPEFLAAGESGTFIIVNYDSFMEYELRSVAGEVSRVGDIITYKPNDVGSMGFIINDQFIKVEVIADPDLAIAPVITSPHDGAIDVPGKVALAYEDYTGSLEVAGVEYRVATDNKFLNVVSSGTITKSGEFIGIPVKGRVVFLEARYVMKDGRFSPWSATVTLNMGEFGLWDRFMPFQKLTGTGDFGYSVAMNHDGSMVIVGTFSTSTGKYAEIYQRSGSTYTLVQKLTGASWFGRSAAMNHDGSIVVVGGFNNADIYERSGSTYTLVQKLTGTGDFGYSVAMNRYGSMVIVGTRDGDYANIYERSGSNYTLVQKLIGTGIFGFSVAMNHDGSMVIVGTEKGNYAEIYERSGSTYTLVQKLTGAGWFGRSAAMNHDGSMVIVGTDDETEGNYAEIYQRSGSTYTLVQKLTGTGRFGYSVAMNRYGSMVIVGTSISSSGNYANIYKRSGSTYTLVQKLTGVRYSYFGRSVAMNHDGSMVIVGTYNSSEGNYAEIYVDLS